MSKYLEIYITEISKYFIVFFMSIYIIIDFLSLLRKEGGESHAEYIWQNIMMFCVHFTCFLSICFETGETEYLVFYAFQQVLLFAIIAVFRLIYPLADKLLLNNICMLLCIGFVILTRLSYDKALKQFFIVAACAVISICIPYLSIKLRFLKDLTWAYAAVGVLALLAVLILGSVTNGSKLSYSIGGITFQPSEFVKILFIFFLAAAFYKSSSFLQVCITALVSGIHVIILVASKDLGSALIFFVAYVAMTFIATGRLIYLLFGLAGGCGAALLAFRFFSHVQVRVNAWNDPWSVIDNAGYQIAQSLFAISSGGWFGLGLFQGNPSTIPYVEKDFVFSAVVQEMGLVFGVCLLLVTINSFLIMMKLGMGIKNKFYQLLSCGIAITYIFQVFLTVGGGAKFIPMTGITLPFISYGGSSVLTTLVMFFVAEGLSIFKHDEDVEYEKRKQRLQQKELHDKKSEKKSGSRSGNGNGSRSESRSGSRSGSRNGSGNGDVG